MASQSVGGLIGSPWFIAGKLPFSFGENMDQLRPATLVERDAVARLLGLNNWRCGVHRFPSEPDIWADCLWWLNVQPSFDFPWAIAGATTHELEETPRYERRGVLMRQQAFYVAQLRDSAIEDAINAVPLMALSGGMSRDGIGYDFYTETVVAQSQFYFSNPQVKEWIALEQVLIGLGYEIAVESGLKELADVMETWCKYAGWQPSSRTSRST